MEAAEKWVRRLGGVLALVTLLTIFYGIARALRRPAGLTVGRADWMRKAPYYFLVGVPYFALCFLLWRPLSKGISLPLRHWMVQLGSIIYFPAMLLVLWGRVTLGEMYNVSSGFGAQLYAGQRLVMRGPYAYIRHPMYLGMSLAALGGLLLYRTWTLVFLAFTAVSILLLRSRREEQALALQFGEEWEAYCRRVPRFIPHLN
jgi:protein-S-isoprenylcysteine O-methyltransferase Ste14